MYIFFIVKEELSCSPFKLYQVKEESKKTIKKYSSKRTMRKEYYNTVIDRKAIL